MEVSTGDGAKGKAVTEVDKPKDRRLPLRIVAFRNLTAIPGFSTMVTVVEHNTTRLDNGKTVVMPQPYLDPILRSIWIEGREFPLEAVHYWERAKMATSKKAEPVVPTHRIGKIVTLTEKAPG